MLRAGGSVGSGGLLFGEVVGLVISVVIYGLG